MKNGNLLLMILAAALFSGCATAPSTIPDLTWEQHLWEQHQRQTTLVKDLNMARGGCTVASQLLEYFELTGDDRGIGEEELRQQATEACEEYDNLIQAELRHRKERIELGLATW